MNLALDHLAASAADELLLDDSDLLLLDEDGNATPDIRWETARTDLAARGWPLDAL